MPEVIFTGPAGRLEGRYHPAKQKNAPIAMILHPHPQFHGTMNHQIVYQCYYAFAHRGFSVLRFNFRGVGRSQGSFDHGTGELSDAAAALDWAQTINPEARACWVTGFSFGAWIGMQLLMRRPEVEGFISIAPPANLYDFSFLAPCPSSGLIVPAEMAQVLADNPFPNAAPNRTVAIFLDKAPPADALAGIRGQNKEEVRLGCREIYVHYGDGMGTSKLVIPAAKTGTARNMNTIATLAKMAAEL